MIEGTNVEATVDRVVDGDTVRVFWPDGQNNTSESLRILSMDTEESNAGGGKPVTPWGHAAKERAKQFFQPGDRIQLEFPGNEDLQTCLTRYRGNYGRLLVWLHKNNVDFQEVMIREGYSPYFMKYGHANFAAKRAAYEAAEREAQEQNLGVWDQVGSNGSEMRNYAALGTWWRLRGRLIDDYRAAQANDPDLLDTRLDFDEISNRAQNQDDVTLFSEVRSISQLGQVSGAIDIGSQHQPFKLFVPDMTSDAGQTLVHMLQSRYFPGDEAHPRRSYVYVSGALSVYGGNPQMVLTGTDQLSDLPP